MRTPFPPRLHAALLLLTALAVTLTSCTTPGSDPRTHADLPVLEVPHLDERALLLLMVDQQRFDPFTVETSLSGPPALREQLAATLGRVDDPRCISYLAQLLADETPAVRRAAAFSLGELGLQRRDAEIAARALLTAAADGDRATGRLAVEALGKLGVAVTEVVAALTASELSEAERWHRLLPPLFRFDEADAVPLALGGLELAAGSEDAGELRRGAAFALSRNPRPEALPKLRQLLADDDPRIRAWAARAVGMVGDGSDLARLAPLLADPEPAPVIQALRAAAVLAAAPDAAAAAVSKAVPEDWYPALLRLADHPLAHVRLELLDRAAPWLPPRAAADDAGPYAAASSPGALLRDLLVLRVADPDADAPTAERAAALVALATGPRGDGAADPAPPAPGVGELIRLAAASDLSQMRAAAATAAGRLAAAAFLPAAHPASAPPASGSAPPAAVVSAATPRAFLTALLGDPAPAVRSAAAAALLARLAASGATAEGEGALTVGELLRVVDAGVAVEAFGWLGEHPVLPYTDLAPALQASVQESSIEAVQAGIGALAARAAAAPAERSGIVTLLDRVARRPDWMMRRAAAAALQELGEPEPEVGHPNLQRTPDLYQDVVQRTARRRHVVLTTDVGELLIELDCPAAPLTCLNFLQLASQGFFDGVSFHRVVPDFVLQAGDPRGDGYGGPGYEIRDELSPTPYERGVVGMALAGPHTGGSQFFIALSPQPHLDGGYTAFGRVVGGLDLLDEVSRGTTIWRAQEVTVR